MRILTLLNPERPKLHRVLAILSAIGLMVSVNCIDWGIYGCTQNGHLGKLIGGFMVINFVVWRCISTAIKCNLGQ